METGINCIAIADHDTIEGALKMQSLAPFRVIVAGEILTPQGEIIGMFLKEGIPIGLPIEQAISRIKDQGAMVCIPHPFDIFRGLRLDSGKLEELVEQIDIIEAFNARSRSPWAITKAGAFAEKHGIVKSAGSDAHSPGEIGNAYIEMPEFEGKDDFLQALEKGTIYGHRSSPLVHLNSIWAKLRSYLKGSDNV